MPELKPLPCPFCNNSHPRLTIKNDGVWCDQEGCPNIGNTYAVSVWQGLPRALHWTTEPPNVAGWYWLRCTADDDFPIIRHVTQRDADEGFAVLSNREWAGPIPAPLEPEAS